MEGNNKDQKAKEALEEAARKLSNPDYFAEADAALNPALLEAGREHEEILRRSRERAPRRVIKTLPSSF